MQKLLSISIALLLFSITAHAQTATEILQKVQAIYAGCRTYSDEALISAEIADTRIRQSYFRTSFVRPAAFRLELWFGSSKKTAGDPWFVWKNGEVIKTGGVTGAAEQNLHFDTALARMASVSGGSAITIPQLLLPALFRNSDLFSLIVDAKITGEEKVDGRLSFRIEGLMLGQPVKLWIDKAQYLVLKVYRRTSFGERYQDSTIQYKPNLNGTVPPENLTLPPASISQLIPGTKIVRPPLETPSSLPAASNPPLSPKLREFGSSLSRSPDDPTGPAAESRANDDDVVRVETNLVVCAVLVIDPSGKIVQGLSKDDFIVKEDDKLQEVASMSLGDNKDLPRSIVLIIDYSGSQLPYIKTSIESAKTLVDKLNPKDRMAVVTDDVSLLVDFTSDNQLLKTRLDSLKTKALSGIIGASDQYDALLASLNELFNSNEDLRPIVIFQTDGDQLEALKGGSGRDPYALPRKYGLEDILTATEKKRATVYSVISGVKFAGLSDDELIKRARLDWQNRQNANLELLRARNFPMPKTSSTDPPDEFFTRYGTQWLRRQTALMGLAKFTGTLPEFLEEPGQADEIYTRVLTDIDRRYVIGYYPTNPLHDGKRRKVNIEVRDHPEYVVWGQKTYFARKE